MKGETPKGTYTEMNDDDVDRGVRKDGAKRNRPMEPTEYASVVKGEPQSFEPVGTGSRDELVTTASDNGDQENVATSSKTKKYIIIAVAVVLVILVIVAIVLIALHFTGHLGNNTTPATSTTSMLATTIATGSGVITTTANVEFAKAEITFLDPTGHYNSSLADPTTQYYQDTAELYQSALLADFENTNASNFVVYNATVVEFRDPSAGRDSSVLIWRNNFRSDASGDGLIVKADISIESLPNQDLPSAKEIKNVLYSDLAAGGYTAEGITEITTTATSQKHTTSASSSKKPTTQNTSPTSPKSPQSSSSTTTTTTKVQTGTTPITSVGTKSSMTSANGTTPTVATSKTSPTTSPNSKSTATSGTLKTEMTPISEATTEVVISTTFTPQICTIHEFDCGNGHCIPLVDKCLANGTKLCKNGEDQMFCMYAHTCRPGEYQCSNKKCIPEFYRCDGYKDCSDGDDESYCSDRCNRGDSFFCDNGNCINKMLLCDFNDDCMDNSDEYNCEYNLNATFKCDAGIRKPASVICNGEFDCKDKTDELFCECGESNDFSCTNGFCLSYDEVFCNGVNDCGDNSDEPSNCTCAGTQFTCVSNNVCIPVYKKCDYTINCIDQSDELNCTCNKNQFGCSNGLGPCIDSAQVCNGVWDCLNGSDEENCPAGCQESQFQCNGHICIPYSDYCDGVAQCPDGDDEPANCSTTACTSTSCNNNGFCCDTHRCFPRSAVCNGFDDCADKTDEANCTACAFRCPNDQACIQNDEICDGVQNCDDGSDEVNCTCGRIIRRSHPEYFNDGYPDCRDFTDENSCTAAFECTQSENFCLPSSKVCNGVVDCPLADDENFCVFLQDQDFSNKTVYQWPFNYHGFVKVLHPSNGANGTSYKQFQPDNDILPLCVDGNLPFSILSQLCVAGDAQPTLDGANYLSANQVPPWFPISNTYYLENASSITNLSQLYSSISRQQTPCTGYFVNISCTAPYCPDPPSLPSVQGPNIVGGQSVDPYAWPYVVHILADGQFLCGGVLISEHHVLTAAHCVQGYVQSRLVVQGGWAHFSSNSPASVMSPVEAVILHPDYNPDLREFDIAIVHTADYFNSTRYLRPFCALRGGPPPDELPNCYALGWGRIYSGGPMSDALQVTLLKPLKEYLCEMIPSIRNPKNITVTEQMFCAGTIDGTAETCDGDDGGPLFCPDGGGQLYLAGISSWRLGCVVPHSPSSIFTYVPNVMDWIDQNLESNEIRVQSTTCRDMFRCSDGKCLPSTKLCDTVWDCVHGEDETEQLCSPSTPGDITCFFTRPSVCGYKRDLTYSRTNQWMWVDYGTAISSFVNRTLHYPNYILFTGNGARKAQQGRLISAKTGIGAPNLCVFADYQIYGPRANFTIYLCPTSHISTKETKHVDAIQCTQLNRTIPTTSEWRRLSSIPMNPQYLYYLVIDAHFDAGAKYDDMVAINNISINFCASPVYCNSSNQFLCNDTDICIPSEFYCDGRIDCPGGEDESRCADVPCFNTTTHKSFYCPSGVNRAVYGGSNRGGPYCIDYSTVCDQEPDCNKAEDEKGCSCASSQLQCDNGRCLDRRYWCNGKDDCGDRSDEPRRCNCSEYLYSNQFCDGVQDCEDNADEEGCNKCPRDQFACIESNYTCINETKVCDGENDCHNSEDERLCVNTVKPLVIPASISRKKIVPAPGLSPSNSESTEGEVRIRRSSTSLGINAYYFVCADSEETIQAVGDGACSSMQFSTVLNSTSFTPTGASLKILFYTQQSTTFLQNFTLGNWSSCTANKTVYVTCSNLICGISQTNNATTSLGGSNIVGGQTSQLHAWPWSATLMTQPPGPFPSVPFYMCGATVISRRFVLTAAHCVSYINLGDHPWLIYVGAGTNRLSSYAFQPTEQPLAGAILLRNESARATTDPNNDIALIYLKSDYNFDFSLWPVCTPDQSNQFPKPGSHCYSTGFGSRNPLPSDIVLSDDLMQKDSVIENCTGLPHVNNNYDPNRDVCVANGGYCLVNGDSGSGLSCAGGRQWYAGGTMSRFVSLNTTVCGQPNFDTRTSYYSNWISNTMYCFPDMDLWPCTDGNGCALWSALCDGRQDCGDGSDELYCPSIGPCTDGFRCKNKVCNKMAAWCDRQSDCGFYSDSSDELPDCKTGCPPLALKCDEGIIRQERKCVPPIQICDGVYDCNDHTDETNCECGDLKFKCKNNLCINQNLYCNGHEDCTDGSDEPIGCSCLSTMFKNDPSRLCDGIVDCPGEKDEEVCQCNANEFTCNKTLVGNVMKCIPNEKQCDGTPDCPAGEDEIDCFAYLAPNDYLGAIVNGEALRVCGDQWTLDAASKACSYQFYNKYYDSHVVQLGKDEGFKGFAYDPSKSNMSFPFWFNVVHNCTSAIIVDKQCGVPMCGVSTAFPDQNFGMEAAQYTSITSNQAPFPFVGALYYNNGFVCSGVLLDSELFAVPASCFRNGIQSTVDLVDYTVRLGTSRLSAVAYSEEFKIISSHNDRLAPYSAKNWQYDYTVVSLNRRAPTNVLSIWPACLTEETPSPDQSSKCYAVGWVPDSHTDTYEVDQVAQEVSIVPNNFCHDDEPSHLCVGHLDDRTNYGIMGKYDSHNRLCLSRYGGVLLCQKNDSLWYFTGLFQGNSTCNHSLTLVESAPFHYRSTNDLLSLGCAHFDNKDKLCRNGGTCVSDSIDYYCLCESGFSGQNCERLNCDQTLTQPTGKIATPSIFIYTNQSNPLYPSEADCQWNINVATGKYVQLSFGHFDLAPVGADGNCTDYVEISQNWWHATNDFIGRYCGSTKPPVIRSISTNLIVRFHSEKNTKYSGFAATYLSVDCLTRITNETSGVLVNPGYPYGYADQTSCYWYITSPDQTKMLKFVVNDLRVSPSIPACFLSYLRIYNGTDLTSIVKTMCSMSLTPKIITVENFQATVLFYSMYNQKSGGFNMSWYADVNNCDSHPCPLDATCVDGIYSFTCTCAKGLDYINGTCQRLDLCRPVNPCMNNAYCVTDNNAVKCLCLPDWSGPTCAQLDHVFQLNSSTTNTIDSPSFDIGFGTHYPNNYYGIWYITLDQDQTVSFSFIIFDVEPDVKCGKDFVYIYEGVLKNPMASRLGGPLCNTNPPNPFYNSTTNYLTITFSTDNTGTYNGFEGRFTAVKHSPRLFSQIATCGGTITPAGVGGQLYSPLFPEPYPESQNCQWTISGDFARTEMIFRSVHFKYTTDTCYDFVDIYDGELIVPQKRLARVCNESYIGVPIRSYSRSVTILFISSNNTNAQYSGFALDYSFSSALCLNNPCKNNGTCHEDEEFITCTCSPRYTGPFCESYATCGGSFTEQQGAITSPNYPGDYNAAENCLWTIVAPASYLIYLRFDAFAVEPGISGGLCLDYVKVYNNSANITNLPDENSYCGFDTPGPFVSLTNFFYIHMISDTTNTWPGFSANYVMVPNYCKKQNPCNDHEECINRQSGAVCHCKPGYSGTNCQDVIDTCASDPCQNNGTCTSSFNQFSCQCLNGYIGSTCSDDIYCGKTNPCLHGSICEHGPQGPICHCSSDWAGIYCQVPRCGGVYTDPQGIIETPDYPYFYPTPADCVYSFFAPAGQAAKFYIDEFELSPVKDEVCVDYLALYNSQDIRNETNLLAKWCGTLQTPFTMTTTSNYSTLVFRAAYISNTHYTGFSLRYFFDLNACNGVPCTGANQQCENLFNIGFHCVCKPGYTGNPCIAIDYCTSNPCLNNGTCNSAFMDFSCKCEAGYTGKVCEIEIDYCGSNPCKYGGLCTNNGGSYLCSCREYLTGPNCETLSCSNITLEGTQGYIKSPGYQYEGDFHYPPNADCNWTIQTETSKIFYLTLETISIEGPFPTCNYDYLAIFDGGDFSQNATRKVCGVDPSLPDPVYEFSATLSNTVGLLFHSDDTIENKGFRIYYQSGYIGYCNGTMTDNATYFNSRSWPGAYPSNEECSWTIELRDDMRIDLFFDAVDLDPNCDETYIDIYDFKYPVAWRKIDRLCNDTIPTFKKSSFTNAMSIVFKSGSNNDGHMGFKAHYLAKVLDFCKGVECTENAFCGVTPAGGRCTCYEGFQYQGDYCIPEFCYMIDCPNGTKCVSNYLTGAYCSPCGKGYSGRYCNYDDWCGYPNNPCNTEGGTCIHGQDGAICQCKPGYTGERCENKLPDYRCGGEYVDFPGLVQSPGQAFVPQNVDCNWVLRSPDPTKAISIKFDLFALHQSTDCSTDYLKIFDAKGSLIATYCGNYIDNPLPIVTSSGSEMTLVLKTGNTGGNMGFSARYFLTENFCSSVTNCPVNGYCQNTYVGYVCQCNAGYAGTNCSKINYCGTARNCVNGGTCISDQTSYHCICPPGYTGSRCETFMDPCLPNPCFHGGSCTPDLYYGNYTCACIDNFYGPNCENPECVFHISENNGVIKSPGYPSFYPTYLNCTYHIAAGHRNIVDFRFLNYDIEGPVPSCIYDAVNIFDGPSTDSPLLGTFCGRSDQMIGPIESTDFDMTITFTTDRTVSGKGFAAFFNITHSTCHNHVCPLHSVCITGPDLSPYCLCDYHYEGPTCNRINDCSFVTCAHGGTCLEDDLGSFNCMCLEGFYGPFCELTMDLCVSFPCQNGGNCIPGFDYSYTCHCPFNFGGDNCERPRHTMVIDHLRTGLILSPNFPSPYPANASYLWVVNAPSPYVGIKLTFTDFATEGGPGDCQDYVVLYDGDLRNSGGIVFEIAKLCGYFLPPSFTSTQTAMSITFDSDATIQFQGFSANFTAVCAPGYIGSNCSDIEFRTYDICTERSIYFSSGYLTSPGYPTLYPPDLNCPVTIDVRPYHHVPLQFSDFQVDDISSTCDSSSVTLYDGHNTSSKLIGKYCSGNRPPSTWIDSSSDAITIVFISGPGTTTAAGTLDHQASPSLTTGFNITFSALLDPCVHAKCYFGECVPTSTSTSKCICDQGWMGDECGMADFQTYNICNFTTSVQRIGNGFLTSPNYPGYYLPNDDCTVALETRPGFVYSFSFTFFSLQQPDAVVCIDHLTLYDSLGPIPSRQIGSFCGNITPIFQRNYTSENFLTVEFHTNANIQARGFNMTFRTIVDYCATHTCPYDHMYCVNLEQDQGYDCVCTNAWTGPTCQERIDLCAQNPCLNGGTCANTTDGYYCKCVKGYLGLNCEDDNYCQESTCRNGGTCSHGETGPVCTCPALYTGFNCENVVCGDTLSSPTGVIQTPNYPGSYPPYSHCVWLISVPGVSYIRIQSTYFQLEEALGGECRNDYLSVWYSDNMNTDPEETFCGINTIVNVTSTGDVVTLLFVSDGSINDAGFSLSYSTG